MAVGGGLGYLYNDATPVHGRMLGSRGSDRESFGLFIEDLYSEPAPATSYFRLGKRDCVRFAALLQERYGIVKNPPLTNLEEATRALTYAANLKDTALTIFLFHGVVWKSDYEVRNYTRKHLDADYFVRVMRELKATGFPISLDVLAKHPEIPFAPKSFAVTFDDGFENVYSIVAPILDELRIPATFYITTDFVDRNRMSWTDRIEWAVERMAFKQNVTLPWADYNFWQTGSKRRMLDDIRAHVKKDRSIAADDLATDIQKQLGCPETWSSPDPLDQKMSWTQVKELSEHHLFTIGGHSHTHPILSFLSPEELQHEIDTSLAMLRDKAGVTTRHYSYPEGLAHCYSDAVVDELKRAGIVCCPTAEDGINAHGTDLFKLKRIMVV